MPREILIQLRAEDKASAKIKKTEQAVASLGSKTTTSSGALTDLGSKFRYLSLVSGLVTGGILMLGRSIVDAGLEAEQSFIKLGAYAQISGEGINTATRAAKNFASTGIVSITEASNTLSNLLATGLNLKQAEILMGRMLDTAILSKEVLTDTFGQALIKSSLGIRILQERQVDAIGINFTAIAVWREYAKTLNKTTNDLTTQEKQLAIINHILKESEKFVGGANLMMNTFSGSVSRLSASFNILKITLSEVLAPLLGSLATSFSNASRYLSDFASNFPGLTFVMMTGITVLGILVTALGFFGALVLLVGTGMSGLSGILGAAVFIFTKIGIAITAVSISLGSLIYFILKITGVWDKWRNSAANLGKQIAENIKTVSKFGNTANKLTAEQIKKQKELSEKIVLATRDYKEGMKEWATKHDETVKDISKQISDLEKDYAKATSKIKDHFNSATSDLALNHARKTEDLQRDIDEEVSKGIWADQTRIRSLRLSLKRENEDYMLAKDKEGDRRDEDLKNEKTQNDEKLTELQEKLNKELEIEQKHAALVAEAKTWPILDEIEKRKRAFEEKISEYNEELSLIDSIGDSNIDMTQRISEAFKGISGTVNSFNRTISNIGLEFRIAKIYVKEFAEAILTLLSPIALGKTLTSPLRNLLSNTFERIVDSFSALPEMIRLFKMGPNFKGIGNYDNGGIVPGPTGSPQPAIVHGGETILPTGVSPITININNPNVRSDNDIRSIALAVQEILSRQQFLRKLQ